MNKKGFTLVELSIVIVLIGLIVAGVIAGQVLIKQAQLRSILSESEQIKSSMNAFKLQYNGLPGDIINGASYWTTSCNAAGTGASDADECNGNGDKQILMAAGNTGEAYIAWKELNLASLYPGSFTPGAVITGSINGNIPGSKFSGAGITVGYDNAASDMTAPDGAGSGGREAGKNVMVFGGVVTNDIANGTIFSVAQVVSLEAKADDSHPIRGSIIAVGGAGDVGDNLCIDDGADDTENTADDTYNLSSTDAAPCAVAFPF